MDTAPGARGSHGVLVPNAGLSVPVAHKVTGGLHAQLTASLSPSPKCCAAHSPSHTRLPRNRVSQAVERPQPTPKSSSRP